MQEQDAANRYPLDSLLDNLESSFPPASHHDVVTNVGHPREFELEPSAFREIPRTDRPKRVAFVDGGNGTIAQSPGFLISLNRLYCSAFRGTERDGFPPDPRVEFFSLVTRRAAVPSGTESAVEYTTSLFPHVEAHRRYMPMERDLRLASRDFAVGWDPRAPSLARRLGEWRMARAAASTMAGGDMLVMDGSLLTLDRTDSKYASDLYDVARERGAIVCALSKTSQIVTKGSEPLLSRVMEIARETPHDRWRVDVADRVSAHDRGFVMAVKLHPNARFAFRFEILREQFIKMDDAEKDHVLASLAANSADISFLGYPYGLVDADRYAQVRNRDLGIFRGLLESRMRTTPGLSRLAGQIQSVQAHEHLNGVSS